MPAAGHQFRQHAHRMPYVVEHESGMGVPFTHHGNLHQSSA